MRKRSDAFYGDSGGGLTAPNNVDISQRRSEGLSDTDWVSKAMKVLRNSPELAGMPALQDSIMSKRLEDLLGDSLAGYDATPEEDARLKQGRPEADEHTERAESLTRDMERRGIRLGADRDEFVANMAEHFRGGPSMSAKPQESDTEFLDDPEKWNNERDPFKKKAGRTGERFKRGL